MRMSDFLFGFYSVFYIAQVFAGFLCALALIVIPIGFIFWILSKRGAR